MRKPCPGLPAFLKISHAFALPRMAPRPNCISSAQNGRSSAPNSRSQSTDGCSKSTDGRSQSTDGRSQSTDGRFPSTDGRSQATNGCFQDKNVLSRSPNGVTFSQNCRFSQESPRLPPGEYRSQFVICPSSPAIPADRPPVAPHPIRPEATHLRPHPNRPPRLPPGLPEIRPGRKNHPPAPHFHPLPGLFSPLNHQAHRLPWIDAPPAPSYPHTFNQFQSSFRAKKCRPSLDRRAAQPDFQLFLTINPKARQKPCFRVRLDIFTRSPTISIQNQMPARPINPSKTPPASRK